MNSGTTPDKGTASQLSYMVHTAIRDKPEWESRFASNWEPRTGELELLKSHVGNGGAFIAAHMNSHHRTSSAFQHSSLAVVDVDYGLSIEEFKAHRLAPFVAWAYTTCNHGKEGDRFRAIFRLPERINNPHLYKAVVSVLIFELGGDKSCKDACRIFYGNSQAEHFIWNPSAKLPSEVISHAQQEARRRIAQESVRVNDYDEITLEQARFVIEQVLEPTSDGERDLFIEITIAAKAGGDALFDAWVDWASRGHHGKGKNSKQATERFFKQFKGGAVPTLFIKANETDPDWRSRLPDELRSSNERPLNQFGSAVGYDHEDFLLSEEDMYGYMHEPPSQSISTATRSVFDALPTTHDHPLPEEREPEWADDVDPDDFRDVSAMQDIDERQERRGRGRPRNAQNNDNEGYSVLELRQRLSDAYPGLRLNVMSQRLEYGPKERPQEIEDVSHAYIEISMGADRVYPKTATFDAAHHLARESAYHPVVNYLQNCVRSKAPIDYLDRFASTILGVKDDPLLNPYMPDGKTLFADEVMKRFLIGAVARAFKPGCVHDWMPIFVGPQNLGKSSFFQYLTPPCPNDPGHYPWVSTVQQGIGYIKDKPHVLHGGWFMIMDECERYFSRKHTEEFKNLVSSPVDRSARKYENERNFKRGFVLAGATNSTEFLTDPTGNRRFMPLVIEGKVTSKEDPSIKIIDLDRLKAERDNIWAAATKLYLDKPTHNFTSYELSHVSDAIESFTHDNPIDGRLRQVMERGHSGVWPVPGGVSQKYWLMSELYEQLDVNLSQQQMQVPISDALKRMGFEAKRFRINGKVTRLWMHKNPPKDHLITSNSLSKTYANTMPRGWN